VAAREDAPTSHHRISLYGLRHRKRARQVDQMRVLSLMALVAVSVAGCGSTTGIVPIGPDTYVLSEMRAPVLGGGPEARRVVMAEASGFCQRQGRGAILLDLRPDGDPFTPYYPTAFDATFQCAAPVVPPGRGLPPHQP